MKKPRNSWTVTRSRELRRDQTAAEYLLWSCLRNRQLAGYKFRRQAPIGRYFVDFICFERRLIVEVDGGQHALLHEHDEKRTVWLTSRDYLVIRFWNNEVLENVDSVLQMILDILSKRIDH